MIKPIPEPRIIAEIRHANGSVSYIADNSIERDPAKVREHLDNIARIWASAEAQKAVK